MSETLENVTQDAAEHADIAPQPATDTAPATGTEQTSTEVKEPDPPAPKQTPWFQKRIDELTREKYEARRQADDFADQLRKIQQPAATSQQTETQPPAGYVPASEVDKRAAERIAEERFVNSCNATAEAGQAKYPDFQTAVSNFGLLGGVKPEFLQAITALGTDDGAKVFYELGSNPDDAARVMSLPPVQMAMEVARRASAPVKQAPVSKVPAPIEPITTNSVRAGPPDAAKSPEAYRKWFAEEYRKSRS